jgi:acyl-CoA thioesterase-1
MFIFDGNINLKNLYPYCRLLTVLTALAVCCFATAAHSASKTVLVLGDSLSAEYGIARGSGWVALLEQRLQHEKLDIVVVNASISGETSSGGKTRLKALLQKHQPHILIIELGANDALRGLALTASEANFRDMISMAKADKSKVLLLGMQIPPNYGRDYTARFASMYGQIAKDTQTALVPFFLAGVAEKQELFQADRLHPLASAHPVILDNVWPQLQILIKKLK